MNLNDILNRKLSQKTESINAGSSFRHHIAMDSVLKYWDIKLNGDDNAIDALTRQKLHKKIKQMGYQLSLEGEGYALVSYLVNGTPVIEVERVVDYALVSGELVYLAVNSNQSFTLNEKAYPISICFRMSNGNVVKTEEYTIDNETFVIEEKTVAYPINFIPAELFTNNELDIPDIPSCFDGMVSELDRYFSEIHFLYNESLFFLNNNSFNSQQNADTIFSKLKQGEKIIDITDPDNKLANALSPVALGGELLSQTQQLTSFFESKIRMYAHQFRDHAGSQMAPSDSSIARYNQMAFEYMEAKLQHIQRSMDLFFAKVSQIWDIAISAEVVTAEFEQIRIDMLRAARDESVGRAEQSLGIADKNKAEAEALRSGAQTPEIVAAGKVDANE